MNQETGYTVQELSKLTGLSGHTLRYYEKEALIPGVKRAPNGHRLYDDGDVEWLKLIRCLKVTGMSIKGIQRFVALFLAGDSTVGARKELLVAHRAGLLARMEELGRYLAKIEAKIEHYAEMEGKGRGA